jgi:hypothetical protein
MMLDPIIITGIPRSRTSMTAQIIELCGVFLGDVLQKTVANPMGQKENSELNHLVQKAHFKRFGFDPKAQKPVPPLKWYEPDPSRRNTVFAIMKKQGLQPKMRWGFKECKASYDWRNWHKAFPNAFWIVTERNDSDIIQSCYKTSFMTRHKTDQEWQGWIDHQKKIFKDMFDNLPKIRKLNTDRLVNSEFTELESIIHDLYLKWDFEKIKRQIQPNKR